MTERRIHCPECGSVHDAGGIEFSNVDENIWAYATSHSGDVMVVRDTDSDPLGIEFPCGHSGVAVRE